MRLRVITGLAILMAGLADGAPRYGYRIVKVYPHDPQAFTQGFEYRGGVIYEGTGLTGKSKLRRVDLTSGKVLQEVALQDRYFGEGITVFDQRIVELTWQSNVGFVYDRGAFRLTTSFYYPGEGWGLANDGKQIFMSDGSDQIRVWDPVTFAEKRRISVHDGARAVKMLNELECVRGEVYANVWQTDEIVRIDPADGRVVGTIDLAGLLTPEERRGADVLNGIAYDEAGRRLFVTGKLWPKIFQIELVLKGS